MAARMPSGAGIVGPVDLVVTGVVLGVGAAFGVVVELHKRDCVLDRRAGLE
jgi:hypothetical protein